MIRLLQDQHKEELKTCAACGYPAPVETFGKARRQNGIYPATTLIDADLCALCANTTAGNRIASTFPRDDEAMLKQICFVGNAILDQLGAFADFPLQYKETEEN